MKTILLRTQTSRLAGCVLLALLAVGCGPEPGSANSGSANASAPAATTSPASGSATSAVAAASAPASLDAGKLVGRWVRPDGGYVLQFNSVDAASGRLDAAYFNPQPIHVARAEAKREGDKLTVFVELQAPNYPGSTYRLTYIPPADQLYGTYYQAALGQSFEVEFVREK